QLYDQEMYLKGILKGDFTGRDLTSLNGTALFYNGLLIQNDTKYPLDSITLNAVSEPGKYHLDMESTLANAFYEGTVDVTKGIPSLIQHFNYYFNRKAYTAADTTGAVEFTF